MEPIRIEAKIYSKAQEYLSRRSYGTSELFSKLHKKFPDCTEHIKNVVEECIRLGYINDAEYTRTLVRNRLQYKHKSLRAIDIELQKKGLNRTSSLLGEHPEFLDMEREALQRAIEKKIRQMKNSDINDREVIQKLKASLYRKGFSLENIEELLNKM